MRLLIGWSVIRGTYRWADEKDGLYIGDRRAAILELADVTGERIGNYSSRVVLLATGTEILAFANGFDKCSFYIVVLSR